MERIAIAPGAAGVIGALRAAGYRAYAVGGCVRDALLGRVPSDWDVCTDALPAQVMAVFGAARCLPTGIRHGTVSVKTGAGLVEVTTFRTEGAYSDGRHPDAVAFVPDVRLDLARRDLTVNAMAYSDDEGLIDPFGGAGDLRAGVLRAVGDPAARFSEDALRILRLFRFGAQLGFTPEAATLDAALSLAGTLRRVSAERISAELTKLLRGARPGRFLPDELLAAVLPLSLSGGARETALRRDTLDALDAASPDALETRLAALLMGAGEEASRDALRALRFPNAAVSRVATLLREGGLAPEAGGLPPRAQARRCLGRMELEDIARLARLREARIAAGAREASLAPLLRAAEEAASAGDCCRIAQLAVRGEDLAALGLSGREIGEALSYLLEAVVREELPNERGALLAACDARKAARE